LGLDAPAEIIPVKIKMFKVVGCGRMADKLGGPIRIIQLEVYFLYGEEDYTAYQYKKRCKIHYLPEF
jgi:hypothetical protein